MSSTKSGKRLGRPRKGEGPKLPYEELDRLLVFGEVVLCEDGRNTTVVYPSYRDLGRRYGVSNSIVADYAKKHNCMRRREVAKARIEEKTDQKLVELRATALALSKDDELRIIDSYLFGFEKALAEGRVRFDNPNDFNTMVRLKAFVQGGADSRQEIHAALSLEDIQARHRRMMRTLDAGDEHSEAEGDAAAGIEVKAICGPRAPSFAAAPEEAGDRFSGAAAYGHHSSAQGLAGGPGHVPAASVFSPHRPIYGHEAMLASEADADRDEEDA